MPRAFPKWQHQYSSFSLYEVATHPCYIKIRAKHYHAWYYVPNKFNNGNVHCNSIILFLFGLRYSQWKKTRWMCVFFVFPTTLPKGIIIIHFHNSPPLREIQNEVVPIISIICCQCGRHGLWNRKDVGLSPSPCTYTHTLFCTTISILNLLQISWKGN